MWIEIMFFEERDNGILKMNENEMKIKTFKLKAETTVEPNRELVELC